MKFKTIFFLFNGIILFSFLFIALMPFFILGGEYTRIFWEENWILALIFFLFISVLDGYFIINWKMFSLLEREDWSGLTAYLEREIYEKKRINNRNIRMMVNASLTISNLEKITRLEKEVRERKPSLLGRFGTMLGLPYLLQREKESGGEFFRECINRGSKNDLPWLQWCYSFLLMSDGDFDEAVSYLRDLSSQTKDTVLQLLSLYLLSTISREEDEQQDEWKKSFLEKYPRRDNLAKIINKSKGSNVVVLLLSSILEDGQNWMYSPVAVS